MKFEVQLEGGSETRNCVVEIERQGGGYRILLDGQLVDADVVQVASHTISILLNGQSHEIHVTEAPDGKLKLQIGGHEFIAEVQDPRAWRGVSKERWKSRGANRLSHRCPEK